MNIDEMNKRISDGVYTLAIEFDGVHNVCKGGFLRNNKDISPRGGEVMHDAELYVLHSLYGQIEAMIERIYRDGMASIEMQKAKRDAEKLKDNARNYVFEAI